MSQMSEEEKPIRFGAEFGPQSMSGTTSGVTLGTFKQLVWISNLGGMILVVIGLEMLLVQGSPGWGIGLIIAGTIIALFPSNFEIVGMQEDESTATETVSEEKTKKKAKKKLSRKPSGNTDTYQTGGWFSDEGEKAIAEMHEAKEE
ncbi:MAG TPA: hypothetical protein EYQ53_05405 [Candidatus Poseidoniales archaeon]|jgi:hypothetical protein|nr:hypothetical protein [Candidatus Poseidoniales archaeon]HIK79117.1 hypothetical protein [Candidatus Poseidoniales archaeon]